MVGFSFSNQRKKTNSSLLLFISLSFQILVSEPVFSKELGTEYKKSGASASNQHLSSKQKEKEALQIQAEKQQETFEKLQLQAESENKYQESLTFKNKAKEAKEKAEGFLKDSKLEPIRLLEERINELDSIRPENQSHAVYLQIQFEKIQLDSEKLQFEAEADQRYFEKLQIEAGKSGSYEDSRSYFAKASFSRENAVRFRDLALISHQKAKDRLQTSEFYSSQIYEKRLFECGMIIIFQNSCRSLVNSDRANSMHNTAKWNSYQQKVLGHLELSNKLSEEAIYWDRLSKKENFLSFIYLIADGMILLIEATIILTILFSLVYLFLIHIKKSKTSSEVILFISNTFGDLLDENIINDLKLDILDIIKEDKPSWIITLSIAIVVLHYFRAGINIALYDRLNPNNQSIESSRQSETDDTDD